MNDQNQPGLHTGTVFIVDDEEIARTSLQRFLKSCGYQTESFVSAADFLARPVNEGIACLILDLQMPNMSGIELQQELVQSGYDIPIVFLTAQGDIPTTVKAMKHGAEDFLPKMADEKELLDAVERALHRSANSVEETQKNEQARTSAASLTDREREICRYVVSGMLNKQIAHKLDIAERTVKAHRAKVMHKFQVDSVAALVRKTQRAGIPAAD